MSLFSENLKEYVQKSHISVSKLSAETEISRTLFHKYLSGNRMPKNSQEVRRIGSAMMLLPRQQEDLLECYARSTYGEKNYESFGKLKHMLEGRYDFRLEKRRRILDMDIVKKLSLINGEEAASFYGRLQVEDALTQLLWLAAGKNRKDCVKVKMIIQPDQDNIINPILRMSSHLDLDLEHIVCLDCNKNDNDNIGLLFSTLAFEFASTAYQSYFYYDNIIYHVNQMSLLPNMLLVGEYVFLCSNEADECLILHQKTEIEFFRKEYEKMKNCTQKLGIINQSAEELAELMSLVMESGMVDLQIGCFPCLLAAMDEKIIQRHLRLQSPAMEKAVQMIGETFSQLKEKRQFRNYFSEAGLRKFMQNGIIQGYPSDIFLPFTAQERMVILKRLLWLLKSGSLSYYMARESRLRMDDAVVIYASRGGDVNFWCKSGAYGKTIMVKETSIVENIHRFIDYAVENDWFYSKQVTIECIEQMIIEYSM